MLMELFLMIVLRIKHTASGSRLCSLKLPKTEDYWRSYWKHSILLILIYGRSPGWTIAIRRTRWRKSSNVYQFDRSNSSDLLQLRIECRKFMGLYIINCVPLKRMVPKIMICRHPWEMIFFHISAVINDSNLEYGFLNNSSSFGGSVAKANEARVSMIRLTHNIWIGFNGDSLSMAAPEKAIIKATILTVNWNWRNFLIESKIFLPHFMAVTMDAKLSSSKIIPEASLATYVPVIPIAKPISAFFRAGASFVPSPVMATTWWSLFNPVAIKYLSVGDDLAKTFNWAETFLKFYMFPIV